MPSHPPQLLQQPLLISAISRRLCQPQERFLIDAAHGAHRRQPTVLEIASDMQRLAQRGGAERGMPLAGDGENDGVREAGGYGVCARG